MSSIRQKRVALLSVSDQTGLVELAHALVQSDFTLLATSGTGKALASAQIPFTSVESYTGLAELLDGRVKTLHPKIHGGILARKDSAEHLKQLDEAGISPIDIVVVNLYPFTKYLDSERAADPESMTELIDIGGPTMIRAAAKNHRSVLPLIDPKDYGSIISHLKESTDSTVSLMTLFPLELRRQLAAKVFTALSDYDGAVGSYFTNQLQKTSTMEVVTFPDQVTFHFKKINDLRYGENPHQKAAWYQVSKGHPELPTISGVSWKLLGGKELSYNNMLDFDAAMRLLLDLPNSTPCVAILKHLNPCGVASAETLTEAINEAKSCDPRSHFGGIIVLNREVDQAAAKAVREDFAELVVAPSYSEEGLAVLRTSKNVRILEVKLPEQSSSVSGVDIRTVMGGVLVQEADLRTASEASVLVHAESVGVKALTKNEELDLDLAWRLVAHVKSNAIVLVKNGKLVGVGAGQMSRIDSVELAIKKALFHGHDLKGAVAASDAFFPFPDSVTTLAEAGVTAVISPAGAKRDDHIKAEADLRQVALVFATERHFRH